MTNQKKGVNINEFLKKQSIDKKSVPIAVSDKQVTVKAKPMQKVAEVNKRKQKRAKVSRNKTQTTTKNTKISMFKYIDASRIRKPHNLLTFINWLAMPAEERELKRQEDLAKRFGIEQCTLSEWKKISGFWDEVAIHRDQYFRKYSSKVSHGLMKRAASGDARACELFFMKFEGFKKNIAVEDLTPERIITDEERAKIEHALKNIGLASIVKSDNDSNKEENA